MVFGSFSDIPLMSNNMPDYWKKYLTEVHSRNGAMPWVDKFFLFTLLTMS